MSIAQLLRVPKFLPDSSVQATILTKLVLGGSTV
jgi:hypothetical protein